MQIKICHRTETRWIGPVADVVAKWGPFEADALDLYGSVVAGVRRLTRVGKECDLLQDVAVWDTYSFEVAAAEAADHDAEYGEGEAVTASVLIADVASIEHGVPVRTGIIVWSEQDVYLLGESGQTIDRVNRS